MSCPPELSSYAYVCVFMCYITTRANITTVTFDVCLSCQFCWNYSGLRLRAQNWAVGSCWRAGCWCCPLTNNIKPLKDISFIVDYIIAPVVYCLLCSGNCETLTCCPFLVFALPKGSANRWGVLVVLVLQPPLCGTRSHLAFVTLPLPIPSVTFLKLTASSRLSAPPSGSPKCLRFGHWLTLCTINIYFLTYLLNLLGGITLLRNSVPKAVEVSSRLRRLRGSSVVALRCPRS